MLPSERPERRTGKADLHLHTKESDGIMTVPELLDYVEQRTDLDVIAVTDHDQLRSSFQARELAARRGLRLQVVTGMEVTTLEGHLLALFLEEEVPSLRSLADTVEAVHERGGLAIIPHPLSWVTHSVGQSALRRLARSSVQPDGWEVTNPTYAGRVQVAKALQLNRQRLRWAETGGSDAHFLAFVGLAYTRFPGRSVEELRQGLERRETRGVLVAPALAGQIGFGQLLRQQYRALVVLPYRLLRRVWSPLPKAVASRL